MTEIKTNRNHKDSVFTLLFSEPPAALELYNAERITKGKDLYREKLIKIPAPEFIVLYNGKDEFPDFKELRLSDSFKSKGKGNLELVTNVYNINKGRNAEIAGKSPVLNGYNELIAEVNRNRQTMEPAEAIEAAIKSCVERNILVYFLEKHASEVLNMLFTEWNMDDALAVRYEEGHEDGREERDNEILDLINKGYTSADIEKHLREQARSATA